MNFNKSSRIIAVQSLVQSIINYCIRTSIWCTTNATLLQKVQRLQNLAARVSVGSLKKNMTTSPQLSKSWDG